MANLKLRVEIQKGVRGVPLTKLAQVVGDIQKFLGMLSDDITLPAGSDPWVGLDFKDGSLSFVAEKQQSVSEEQVNVFNSAFVSIVDQQPLAAIRRSTIAQYTKIAAMLDDREAVSFDLYNPRFDTKGVQVSEAAPVLALRHVELTKLKAKSIDDEIQATVKALGSLQGKIHSLFLGADDPHFQLRELSTGALVKCTYSKEVYPDIAKALQRQNAVLHVYGTTYTDLVNRKLEEMEVSRVDVAEEISEADFERVFGSMPRFTGKLTTQEFIQSVRGRVH